MVTPKPNLSKSLQNMYPSAQTIFRDSYTLDFPGLPPVHFEADLRKGIVASQKHFLIEFGRDFAFIAEKYRVLGKMSFYLESLDRDVRKPHEKPSVGIILCK